MLCQLSYGPSASDCTGGRGRALYTQGMARGKRPSLGALFLVLAAAFAGIAFVAADSGGAAWAVAFAAGVLAVWMGELAFRTLR